MNTKPNGNTSRFALIAILAALGLVVSGFAWAGDGEGETRHKFKIVLDDGGEHDVLKLEAEDLEVGETRELTTDSGKEVVIARTEEGFDITVDGKEIVVGGEDHSFVHAHGEGRRVIVHHTGDGESEHHAVFINEDGEKVEIDGEHEMTWVTAGGEHGLHVEEGPSVADQLVESGVLDGLDTATRQDILDELKKIAETRIKKRVVIVESDELHTEESDN